MSIRDTIASALEDFPFDPHAGFLGHKLGDQPCYYCVISLRDDFRVCCVVGQHSMSRCLICAEEDQVCCAIPEELLGAAQKIWNWYHHHVRFQDLTGLQRWRIAKCIDDCTSAFRSTYNVLLNPFRTTFPIHQGTDVIHAQELASQHQIMSLIYRVLAGEVHSPAQVNANLAAVAPAYTTECTEAETLDQHLHLIDMCPDTAAPGERQWSDLPEFRTARRHGLMDLVWNARCNGAPPPQVTDRTPGRNPARQF